MEERIIESELLKFDAEKVMEKWHPNCSSDELGAVLINTDKTVGLLIFTGEYKIEPAPAVYVGDNEYGIFVVDEFYTTNADSNLCALLTAVDDDIRPNSFVMYDKHRMTDVKLINEEYFVLFVDGKQYKVSLT